jgi:hypothetical protein
MIKTIEIAPDIFVDNLIKVVDDELYESITMEGGDQWGVYLNLDKARIKKAFLKIMNADQL